MAVSQASSRLEMLQARFQQKQMQEKEQKLLQIYDQQQQRAYQVVQRGSAGSNGSISQHHTVTKTTTSTHTTSSSQGGKVRQMFDERRQTTVKGIDRSYPLEPLLDNKSKKQIIPSNGHVPLKPNQHGNVTRQSVTVRRTARSDINSNVNGGKPIVSYREEVSHESFGNDNDLENGNRDIKYQNEDERNSNQNGVHIEEILDDDTIERNRMLAKIHLMEYDKNLKHRVNNDLNSEKFPEDLLVDVPDKLPKKLATKKLSQAEARLEKFKNSNARRNTATSVTTTNRTDLRKRSEPIFPSSKTTSRNSTTNSKTKETIKARRSATEPLPLPVPIQSPKQIARKIFKPRSTKPVEPQICSTKTVKLDVSVEKSESVKPLKNVETKPVETVKTVIKSLETSPRTQKSPSPKLSSRRSINSTAKTTIRKSTPPSPSKSPEIGTRHGFTGSRSPEPKPVRKTFQDTTNNRQILNTNKSRVVTEEFQPMKIIDVSNDLDIPSKFSIEANDLKSSTISQETLNKNTKTYEDEVYEELKVKEQISDNKSASKKFSSERSTPITRNQRQSSPISSQRPPSALSTASSTTNSTKGNSPGENQIRKMATKAKNPTRSPGQISKSRTTASPTPRSGSNVLSSDSLVPCKICGRRFAQDRISLHEKICAKAAQKKRKQFDTVLHRVQGTELESFAKKGSGPVGKQTELRLKGKKPEVKAKSNWRRKHEDFINAIRSAKQVQAHLAAGGKLSDLPPPPASDTSDYIQCPHCGRKFNQSAAERHIPKCANMMHNKPNPRAPPKPKR